MSRTNPTFAAGDRVLIEDEDCIGVVTFVDHDVAYTGYYVQYPDGGTGYFSEAQLLFAPETDK